MDTRVALVAVMAFMGAPLLRPCSSPGSLDDIASWAMQGPAKDLPARLNGVFVFRGVSPALLVDMSYSHSYLPAEGSFVLDAGRAYMYDTDATSSRFTGMFQPTSPTPELPGKLLSLLSRMMRLSLKFTLNADRTVASIEPMLISQYNPFNKLFPRILKEQAVAYKGGWKRVNFAPPSNATATSASYTLHPVVTRKPDGSLKVHGDGLKMAKRKLAMGSGSFAKCP
ncbi:hypothetical protein KFE25_000753 [Diacronema lutheri]|uniref:Uncharacterized protein n=1 Tax=Diacronema lutheri TaxID=2081491 RepID=A0A8J6CAB4_DIALT|nr:hypothetical protein KFE25_000753 [Diacronema lutheri]